MPEARLARETEANTIRSKTDEYAQKLYNATAEADEKVVKRVQALAKAHGVPPARIALAWLLHKPGIAGPIIGASKPNHIEDAVAAVTIKLTPEEIKHLEEAYVPHAIAGHE